LGRLSRQALFIASPLLMKVNADAEMMTNDPFFGPFLILFLISLMIRSSHHFSCERFLNLLVRTDTK